jgi:hypothetical protein
MAISLTALPEKRATAAAFAAAAAHEPVVTPVRNFFTQSLSRQNKKGFDHKTKTFALNNQIS